MGVLSPKKNKPLVEAIAGRPYKVVRVNDLLVAKRLFSMGLLPGTMVTLVRQGVLSGTCYVKAGMITLALRKEEAAAIEIA